MVRRHPMGKVESAALILIPHSKSWHSHSRARFPRQASQTHKPGPGDFPFESPYP